MSIRTRTVLILGSSMLVLILALTVVSNVLVLSGFRELEARSMQADVRRGLKELGEEMCRARGELASAGLEDSGKEKLERFLAVGSEGMSKLLSQAQERLGQMQLRIEQVEEILNANKKWASSNQPAETVVIDGVLTQALELVSEEQRALFTVEWDFPEPRGSCTVDAPRVTLIQILLNLLKNAAESVERSKTQDGRIRFGCTQEIGGALRYSHITVCDSGEGMSREALERVFTRKFSTKQGRSGIGLHWCANALAVLQGRIRASSEGLGKGACFHIYLPSGHEGGALIQ